MEQIAFTMQLKPGCETQYRMRHDALWPELAELLRAAGVRDYSIFLEPDSGKLFAVLRRTRDHGMEQLPAHPVMRRWWDTMADLMETAPDNTPVSHALTPMFHLP
ncbi:L-rhamnose mutarotase [Herbaspirillum robiniae]|uniref:L-rhamnose mutarotase n=1 Tax=Herbaspirillum robiniae TaxID=2014887 RepID=UPI003D772927